MNIENSLKLLNELGKLVSRIDKLERDVKRLNLEAESAAMKASLEKETHPL